MYGCLISLALALFFGFCVRPFTISLIHNTRVPVHNFLSKYVLFSLSADKVSEMLRWCSPHFSLYSRQNLLFCTHLLTYLRCRGEAPTPPHAHNPAYISQYQLHPRYRALPNAACSSVTTMLNNNNQSQRPFNLVNLFANSYLRDRGASLVVVTTTTGSN